MTEDERVGWHHQLDGHEHGQTARDGEEQEALAYCSPWGCKEVDRTQLLNNSDTVALFLFIYLFIYFLRNLHAVSFTGFVECHCFEIAVHWYFVITEQMTR